MSQEEVNSNISISPDNLKPFQGLKCQKAGTAADIPQSTYCATGTQKLPPDKRALVMAHGEA